MLSDGLKAKRREEERKALKEAEAQKAKEAELASLEPGLEPKESCAGCPKKRRRRKKRRSNAN